MRCPECDHVVAHAPFCTDCGVALHAKSVDARAATYPGVLGPLVAGLGAVVAAGVATAVLITPATKAYVCPPDCGRPPLGTPVETNPRFSGDNGAFSVAYPGEGSAYEVTFDPPGMNGVELKYTGGDTGILRLFGEPARDRTPKADRPADPGQQVPAGHRQLRDPQRLSRLPTGVTAWSPMCTRETRRPREPGCG